MHNDELYNLYASPGIIRVIITMRIRWTGHVARMGEMKIYIIFWLENLKVRRNSKILSVQLEDNIRMYIMGLVLKGVNWMHLAQDRDQ